MDSPKNKNTKKDNKDSLRLALERLATDQSDHSYINSILDELGYESVEDLVATCEDAASDDDCQKEIEKALEDINSDIEIDDEGQKELVKISSRLSNIAPDRDWYLPQEMFNTIGRLVSSFSQYGGAKTVIFKKDGLKCNTDAAVSTTQEDHDKTGENYRELLKTIEDYVKNGINPQDNYGIFCCLAKLYNKLKTLNHDKCNQENAIEVAELLNSFNVRENNGGIDDSEHLVDYSIGNGFSSHFSLCVVGLITHSTMSVKEIS